MVEVKSEPANFERFSAALMLTRVDAGIQCLQQLIVAKEQRVLVHRVVQTIDRRIERIRLNHYAFVYGWYQVFDAYFQIVALCINCQTLAYERNLLAEES